MKLKNTILSVAAILLLQSFVFAQPSITSFLPISGMVGTTVTITGTNFNSIPTNNIVYFGAVKAVVNTATLTSLTVTVPLGAVQQRISVTVNGLTGFSVQPFSVTYAGGGNLAGRSFESAIITTINLYPYGLTIGDFDNDGKPDVATVSNANVPASYVAVHRNSVNGGAISFDQRINLNINDFGFGVVSADFDGDGKLDLAATSIDSGGQVSVYKNNSTSGNINFATAVVYPAGNSPYTVVSSDIDGDGKPDLVICNYTGNTVSVLRNTSSIGTISFAPKASFLTALGPYDLAIGDLDGDGKPDVVTGNQFSNNVSALRNTSTTGNISFASKVDYIAGSAPLGVAVGDVDGDNKPEIAFVNNGSRTVSLLRNTSTPGSFSFASRKDYTVADFDVNGPRRVAISDLDADTKPDLIVTGSSAYVLQNNCTPGTIAFGSALSYASYSAFWIGISDMDMDGKPDIVASNSSLQAFSIFRNRVPAPQITSVVPSTAGAGATVIINGYNFNGTTGVWFGDIPAASFTVNNANSISAVVGSGASGSVKLTTGYGSDSINSFVFAGPPVISSISLSSATTGDTVIISGQNFNNATGVSFGGTAAFYFTIVSPGIIKAVVGFGASGAITITTSYGTGSFTGFVYLPVPMITSFSPVTAATGTAVAIIGRNFTGVTSVLFGGIPASSFTVSSPTLINAVVGNGASGSVSVTNSYGTGSRTGFTYIPPPIISSFTPTSAGPGLTVTINGDNFTGTTSVMFGNRQASSFNVVSSTKITAVVSGGASGDVSVTNAGGTGTLPGFTFVPTPSLNGFSPRVTGVGGVITITGNNLSTATNVTIGGSPASFNVVNSTTITAVVGNNNGAGSIVVTTLGGSVNTGIFYLTTSPIINSFFPQSGNVGATVTITGANFSANTASNIVFFGGVKATVSAATQNTLTVTVPAGANYRPISVTTNNLTAYSLKPFAVTFAGGGAFHASSFAGRIDFVTGGNPESITSGDLDGDGKHDVVVANVFANTISIFRNTTTAGNLSFATKIDSVTGLTPHSVKLSDIDADGKLDIVLLNNNPTSNLDNFITIFRNTSISGNLSFAPRIIIPTNYRPRHLVMADINLDGKPDLAITYNGTGGQAYILIYPNQSLPGSISFTQPQEIKTSTSAGNQQFFQDAISVADINKDDRPDVVIGFGLGAFVSLVYNQTNIGATVMNMQYECLAPSGSCWFGAGFAFAVSADFNDDDYVDVITDSYILQSGTPTSPGFKHRNISGIGGIMSVDGLSGVLKPDFARINLSTNTISAVKNISTIDSIKFLPDVNYNTGTNPSGITTADFNGDGKVDIAVTNKDFNTFSILLNNFGNTDPLITSFIPTSGNAGSAITISGSNFTNITAVTIGGEPVTSFNVVNSTTITAIIGNGVSGNVSVAGSSGTTSLGWFYYAPSISSFSPVNAGTGISVTITGNNFTGATAVSFGGVAASSFTVLSSTSIAAVVGNGGASGNIIVTTPAGTATATGFTYVSTPVVSSFTPANGATGTVVTITGTNLTGASALRFGATDASSFTVVSPTTITATVGNGSTGNIFVTTPGGTTYSINQIFTFISPPAINSFTPASAVTGNTITITGTNFTGATAVNLGGTPAASFTVVSPTVINAVVANGASGNVTVTTPGGTAILSGFTFNFPTALPGITNNYEGLVIFPNPAENSISINHPANSRNATIRVIDIYGRTLIELYPQRNTNKSQLDIWALAAGIYKVVWSDDKNIYGGMFFKK